MTAKPIAKTPWLHAGHHREGDWYCKLYSWICKDRLRQYFPESEEADIEGHKIRFVVYKRAARGRVKVFVGIRPFHRDEPVWWRIGRTYGDFYPAMVRFVCRVCLVHGREVAYYVEMEIKT